MRLACLAPVAAALCLLTGCHSAYVEAAVTNSTGEPITVIEVDYPSASFGTQNLSVGQTYNYRFKVQGQGPTKLLWTDAQHHDHTADGPELSEKDEGRLNVTLLPSGPAWKLNLTNRAAQR